MSSEPDRRPARPTPAVWAVLALLFALALGLRIAYLHTTQVDQPIRADAAEYWAYAENLVEHGVFSKQAGEDPRPDSFRSPGYPALLAGVRLLVGKERLLDAILHLQALAGALLVPLVFALGRRFLSDPFALLAAGLACLSPHLVTACGYLLTEACYACALLAALWITQLAFESRSRRLGLLAGLLFAAAWAFNETALIFPPLLVGAHLLAQGRGPRGAWRAPTRPAALAFLLAFACFPLGWQLRNTLRVAPDAPRSSQRALATLTHGTYPNFEFAGDPRTRPYPYRFDPEQPAISRSWSRFTAVFSRRFAADPALHLEWFVLGKPATLWGWSFVQGAGDIFVYPVRISLYDQVPAARATYTLMRWLHTPLVLLAAAAALTTLARALRRPPGERSAALTLALCLLGATALFVVFAPWPRYAVPLRPLLYLLASASLAFAWSRVRALLPERSSTLTAPAGGGSALASRAARGPG